VPWRPRRAIALEQTPTPPRQPRAERCMQLSSGPQRTALAANCFSRRRRQRTPVLFRTELALYSDTPAGQGLIDLRFACLLLCQRTLGRMGARPVALGSVRYFPCCMAAADHLRGAGSAFRPSRVTGSIGMSSNSHMSGSQSSRAMCPTNSAMAASCCSLHTPPSR
jgi:hypothetical protein